MAYGLVPDSGFDTLGIAAVDRACPIEEMRLLGAITMLPVVAIKLTADRRMSSH
ncbi:MAG TPA: hypothetical protein VFS89_09540 [Nitrosospira sp.]|nr:hypothetical protein [Nitrosospira sp.]